MEKVIGAYFLFLFSTVIFSVSVENIHEDDNEYVLRIKSSTKQIFQDQMDTLHSMGIQSIEAPKNASFIEVYVNLEQLQMVENVGLQFEKEINPSIKLHQREMEKSSILNKKRDTTVNQYHNYNSLVSFIDSIVQQYPLIAKKISIGESNQGRSIIGIKLSKNPEKNEVEPEFKYVGNMHGDETVGREMLIQLINLFCTSYGKDDRISQRITKLIEKTAIYIIPSMNPDGFEAGRRGNSKFIDLNRNFPDLRFPGREIGALEPEASSIMNFTLSNYFVLSANFHGGSVVANYPFDGNYYRRSGIVEPTQDDDVFRHLSQVYSNAHSTMHLSTEFTNGITNGAEWYVLYGGMQDWNYLSTGCMEITVELSDIKYPNSIYLQSFWDANKISLISYIEQVHTGIRGVVVGKDTRLPIEATLTVAGRELQITRVDPENGDYYRILRPGTYSVTVSAAGHISQTQQVVVPESAGKPFGAVEYNFELILS